MCHCTEADTARAIHHLRTIRQLVQPGRSFPSAATSPAALLALVLILEPLLERREVLEDRARIHVALTGELEQRILPRLARAERQHLLVGGACFLVAVEAALVE